MEREPGLVRMGAVVHELGLSASRIRQLADERIIPSTRTAGGHRLFDLAAVRAALARRALLPVPHRARRPAPTWLRTVELRSLQEDAVWKDLVAQTGLDATAPAGRIVAYAFTEMLNNAIDHSGGRKAQIRWWATPSTFSLEISDDGEGVFTHLRNGLGLEDEFRAIQELTKGKRTTAPERHTGEGIFFTSKAVDLFLLESGGLRWTVDNLRSDQAVGQSDVTEGTLVTCEIDRNSTRQLRDVFEAFTSDAVFDRTRPVVKLFAIGVRFVSRSEAKRLLDGLERFAEVEVDFTGVEEVGQGFVDELVRVWPSDHPDTRITPTNMTAAVEFMVRRGLPGG